MVYNFLGIVKKIKRNLLAFDQNIRTVYSNISTVYRPKNHVTTHHVFCNGAYQSSNYGDLVNKFNRILRKPSFSDQSKKVTQGYKK